MALHIVNTDNVTDDATVELSGPEGVATAVIAGTAFLFVTGRADSGVAVFSVAADGTLTNVDNVTDAGALELLGASALTTAVVAGNPYLFVTGAVDNGVSVFSIAADGTLINVDNEADSLVREIEGANGVTTAVVGGVTYLFVTGFSDDGVSVFSVAGDGTLTNVDNVADGGSLQLDGARGVTTAVVAGTTYLFVASLVDDGVSVFSVAADGNLANVENVVDGGARELDAASDVATAVVAGATYLFVAAFGDNGVSVFSVAADGTLTNVDNVTDDATLELDRARDLTTTVIGDTTYLFVTGQTDNGVSAFAVGADGTLTNVANIADDATTELRSTMGVATAVVGGTTHLFAAGSLDPGGVSAFALADENVSTLGDVLWRHSDGTVATAARELPAVAATFAIAGTGDFDADGDADILWRHDQGGVVIWEMQGGDLLATHSLPQVSTAFQIRGTGDFDGDGDADILWRHSGGQNVIWEIEDGAFVANHNLPQAATSFQVAGTGDFDDDGDADILWRHVQGQTVIWEIEDGAFVTNHNLPAVSNSFQIAGTGDFDADGDADILWRHDEGTVVIWEMEAAALVTNHNLPQASNSFAVEGTEDFDSDGDADILWRHEDGLVVTWEIEDAAFVQANNFGVVPVAWQIQGTGEFDLV
jgi:6-phosphogluconolactonase (cycloisomerase 2 family)